MNAALIQKLMFSIASLTGFYLIFIFILHEDLTAPIKHAAARFIPAILMFISGVALYNLLANPPMIDQLFSFKSGFLNIKSGFIRRAITEHMLPLVATSVLNMAIMASQIAVVDKLIFVGLGRRLPYIIALVVLSGLGTISAMTIYALIMADPGAINIVIKKFDEISDMATLTLNIAIAIFAAIVVIKEINYITHPKKK